MKTPRRRDRKAILFLSKKFNRITLPHLYDSVRVPLNNHFDSKVLEMVSHENPGRCLIKKVEFIVDKEQRARANLHNEATLYPTAIAFLRMLPLNSLTNFQ